MDISNVNETNIYHNLPPRPPSNIGVQTRQKIVEILAGTANGCLSELGYFPGMPQRLEELEHQNEQWRLENMKLYQDNASLLELIHQQSERIRGIRVPDSEKNMKIMELDVELQKMRTQRDELLRAQSAYNSTPSQLQQNFAHLQGDYIRVLNGYRAMCTEVERLQGQVRTLTAKSQPQGPQPLIQQHQPQKRSQQQCRPQIQPFQYQPLHQPQPIHVQHPQPNHPSQQQSVPTLLQPHVQKHVQQQQPHQPLPTTSLIQPGQQIITQSPSNFVHGQKQRPFLAQTQQAIFEQKRQPSIQSQQPRSRQPSGSMPVPSPRPSQDSFVNMANPQQHPALFSGAPSSSHSNSKPHPSGSHAVQSTSPMVPTMPQPLVTQSRDPFSNNSSSPTPAVPSHSPLSQQFSAPPSSNSIPDPPKIATPLSNIAPSSSIEPSKSNVSTSVPLTISPHDTYLKPVNQVPSPLVKDVQNFNTDTTSAGTSISPVKAPVTSQLANIALSLPASVSPQIKSLKRDSPTRPEDHEEPIEQLQKRSRLEGTRLELTRNITIEPVADGMEDALQMDIDEDDDIIEVGPDGLRLVEDCISDLFGEEDEGKDEEAGRYCKLCIVRCKMGYRVDPPKPFVNATIDELQEHCMTEHAEAWDTLRRSV